VGSSRHRSSYSSSSSSKRMACYSRWGLHPVTMQLLSLCLSGVQLGKLVVLLVLVVVLVLGVGMLQQLRQQQQHRAAVVASSLWRALWM
jgi:hypothetical protein